MRVILTGLRLLKIITCVPAFPLKRRASGSAYGTQAGQRRSGAVRHVADSAASDSAEHDSVRRHLAPVR
jgi:hypothetical protein